MYGICQLIVCWNLIGLVYGNVTAYVCNTEFVLLDFRDFKGGHIRSHLVTDPSG